MPIAPRSLVLALLLSSLALSPALAQAPAEAPPARSVPSLEVEQITLDNGLRIFVLERPASPTFAAYYQFGVGGAMDPKGASGIAHLLEHMMFKGTRSIGTLDADKEAELIRRISELWHRLHRELDRQEDPFDPADPERIAALRQEIEKLTAEHKKLVLKNEYDELITRAGGVSLNASTNNDATNYFVQLPANQLETWFRLESERLLDPVFREFYSERDVVQEERRLRLDNSPSGKMFQTLQRLLYQAHPYGTPVIGWPHDIERLTREEAEAYFRTYYSPSNCIMVLAGDVEAERVESLARKYFGRWQRQELPRLQITAEPEQDGERRAVVEFNAEPQLMMGWPTVPEGHPDQVALDVLGTILGGLWSSRLDKSLVQEARIAASAGSGHLTRKHGGFFFASATVREGHTAAEAEAAIEEEIRKIAAGGVSAEELERAKVSSEASRVRGLKSNLGQAFRIADAVFLAGDVGYVDDYAARLEAVTGEQVQAVAERYLIAKHKNVVELRKNEDAVAAGARTSGVEHQHGGVPGARGAVHSPGFKEILSLAKSAPPVELKIPQIGKDVERVELESGITVFIKEDHSAPSVEMGMSWLGGSNTAPIDELPIFELASSLLDEGGTESLDPIALQERKDELGMSFSVGMGATQSFANFWSLKRNFDDAFDLALEVLMRPRFDAERLTTLKGQYVERMRRRWDVPGWGAALILQTVLYKDHPRLGFVAGREQIEAVTPEDVRRVWRRYLGKDNLYVTVVGDFDRRRMLELLEAKLGGWRDAESSARDFLPRPPVVRPGVYVVEKAIPQAAVRMTQQIEVDRTVPLEEHAAIEIMNDILGGSGFRSRLMERLRSDEGLTYGIGSFISHDGRPGVPGVLTIGYQTKTESVARSIDSVLEELRKIIAEDVSAAEIEEQIDAWRNAFIFRYTNDFFSVFRLMANELDDRPYDYDRRLLEAVQNVRIADVRRVAEKYLKPEHLSIAVFGTLTDEDRQKLAADWKVEVLPKEAVFRGGYDAPAEDESAGR
ncbi:MAG: insulinase family protein [Acidobacteria bacterium]|nr:MAG: insulinase family protein [Acidobacteriota bacterium]